MRPREPAHGHMMEGARLVSSRPGRAILPFALLRVLVNIGMDLLETMT